MRKAEVRTVRGEGALKVLDSLARLRIAVFREYPYLYEGKLESEREYLEVYAKAADCCLVLAEDGKEVVGASTALPLLEADEAFQLPFAQADYRLEEIFYFGESVLLPNYRGQGIGHAFFDARETHARKLGYQLATFCAVDRDGRDSRRPEDYRPHDVFWAKRGYEKQDKLVASFPWLEVGNTEETMNSLTFWTRAL